MSATSFARSRSERSLSFEERVKPIGVRIGEFFARIDSLKVHSLKAKSKVKSKVKSSRTIKWKLASRISSSALADSALLDLCEKEKKFLELLYPNRNTQHRYFTKYRNFARGSGLAESDRDLLLGVLKLSEVESEKRSYQRDLKVHERTNNVALFDRSLFMRYCRSLLAYEDDPYTLVISLMGLTGRRPIEVLKTATFSVVDERHLLFSGQAKTKNSLNAQKSYIIPVLAPAQQLVDALNLVRTLLPLSQRENEHISRSSSQLLATRMKRFHHCIFPNKNVSLNCRTLRSIYVTISYDLFSMATKSSFNAFASRVLGHSPLDQNTANSYAHFASIKKIKKNKMNPQKNQKGQPIR